MSNFSREFKGTNSRGRSPIYLEIIKVLKVWPRSFHNPFLLTSFIGKYISKTSLAQTEGNFQFLEEKWQKK